MFRSVPRCNPAFTHAEAVTHYEAGTGFAEDALGELANTAVDAVPASLLGEILAWFRGTATYSTVIDDFTDGFRQ